MKVTIKGQVTIPIVLRERFGLRPGTEVEFVAEQGSLQVRPRKAKRKMPHASELWLDKAAGSAVPGKKHGRDHGHDAGRGLNHGAR